MIIFEEKISIDHGKNKVKIYTWSVCTKTCNNAFGKFFERIVHAFHINESNQSFSACLLGDITSNDFSPWDLLSRPIPRRTMKQSERWQSRMHLHYYASKKLHTSVCLSCIRWTIPYCTEAPVYNDIQYTRWEYVIVIYLVWQEKSSTICRTLKSTTSWNQHLVYQKKKKEWEAERKKENCSFVF